MATFHENIYTRINFFFSYIQIQVAVSQLIHRFEAQRFRQANSLAPSLPIERGFKILQGMYTLKWLFVSLEVFFYKPWKLYTIFGKYKLVYTWVVFLVLLILVQKVEHLDPNYCRRLGSRVFNEEGRISFRRRNMHTLIRCTNITYKKNISQTGIAPLKSLH